jgi:hypothetical protein
MTAGGLHLELKMISLEQVQELEIKVAKAIEYIQQVTAENSALVAEKESLLSKLEVNQKRLDELELLVMRFKEDQGRIEDGIIAALDRLSQFEEAFENSLKEKTDKNHAGVKKTAAKKKSEPETVSNVKTEPLAVNKEPVEFFEIKSSSSINEEINVQTPEKEESSSDGELDIF